MELENLCAVWYAPKNYQLSLIEIYSVLRLEKNLTEARILGGSQPPSGAFILSL